MPDSLESVTHAEGNREGLERLRSLVARLDEEALSRRIDNGWTVAATLAHIAFWDCWNIERWAYFQEHGKLAEMPDLAQDFVNAAALEQWSLMPQKLAAESAIASAERVIACIDALPDAAVKVATEGGRLFMLDRRKHWYPHLEEIEQAVS